MTRYCAECNISEDQQILYDIMIPPEIPEKTSYCKKCLTTTVIDNVNQKTKAKLEDITKQKQTRANHQ